jgi:hypothetical protein
MPQSWSKKAPFNDWWYWSECLVKRLRTIGDLYRENGEAERGETALNWSKKLKDNCMTPVVAARKGLKTDEQKAEVKKLEEAAIFDCVSLFRDLLVNLPFMSSAIQDFLRVNWQECKWEDPNEKEEIDEDTGLPIRKKKKKSSGDTRITELFWGPKARQDEGIRSGKAEDGGLPGILANLLAAEKTTSSRSPTEYGQAMLASATQSGLATTMNQMERMGVQVNFKPGGSI